MPFANKREHEDNLAEWASALPSVLSAVRARAGLAPDEVVPDAVLLAEVEHHFTLTDLWPPEEWFRRRLAGEANSASQRQHLLSAVLTERRQRKERGARKTTYALIGRPGSLRSRRDQPPTKPPV
jgi:type II secretory pathway component PulL